MEELKKAALKMRFKDWEKMYRLQLVGYNAQQLYISLHVKPKKKTAKKKK